MKFYAALDIGTSNVRLSYYKNKVHHITTLESVPALIGLDPDGGMVFGQAAERLSLQHPDRVIPLVDYLQQKNSLKAVTAFFTQLLTQAQLLIDGELEVTVVGVPCLLSAAVRNQLAQAIKGALPNRPLPRLISSPVLTALYYAVTVPSANTRKLLIADLGGGSTDFVAAEYDNDILEILSIESTREFSGSYVTKGLCDRALEDYEFRSETRLPVDKLSRLQQLQATEHAKRGLNQLSCVRIMLPGAPGAAGEVTRTDLFDLLRQKARPITAALGRTLTGADWDIREADRVLLSGELTRVLGIEEPLGRLLGTSPMVMGNAGFAAVDGGAMLAGYLAGQATIPLVMNIAQTGYAVAVPDRWGRLVPVSDALTVRPGTTFPVLCRQSVQPGTYYLIAGDLADPFAHPEVLQRLPVDRAGTLVLSLDANQTAAIYLE